MNTSLSNDALRSIREPLTRANDIFNQKYPGELTSRQPVHTVYGGAQIFSSDTARKMSDVALKTLIKYAPDGRSLAKALGAKPTGDASGEFHKLWDQIHQRVTEKLKREAVEDFRIDFEDGYGVRPDAEEDGHAEAAAREVAKGMAERTLPPFIGIRLKPFNEPNIQRSLRTLDIFVSTLVAKSGGKLPEGFVITLPKITCVEQASSLTQALDLLEKSNRLAAGSLKFEIMVETTQSILDLSGKSPLRSFVDAGKGRCIGAHFGTYDYTAGCNITAAYQTMANPVCDFAKHVMQVSLAGTPVMLSDGATNIMPVGPHRETADRPLTREQELENEAVVHRAWKISYDHIRHSLETGFYQGWDLHPAQLPIRYAAMYAFFLEALTPASQRLKGFMEKAARATLLGDVFDDAATGQGLLNFFLRGISSGAMTEKAAEDAGLTIPELHTRSFLKILQLRKTV
jgi:hypothetical protein